MRHAEKPSSKMGGCKGRLFGNRVFVYVIFVIFIYLRGKALVSGRSRFGLVTVWGWNGSIGSGSWFRHSSAKGFSEFQYSLAGKAGSGFGSWRTVLAVPVLL